MALIDKYAGAVIARERKLRGHSPESLAEEIRRQAKTAPWGARGAVDAHTIRRIEKRGHVPGMRVQFVLAHYFGMRPDQIWDPAHSVELDRREGVAC